MQGVAIVQNQIRDITQRVDGAVVAAIRQFAGADVGKDGFMRQSSFMQRNECGKRGGAGKKIQLQHFRLHVNCADSGMRLCAFPGARKRHQVYT